MAYATSATLLLSAAESFSAPATRSAYFDLYSPDAVLHGYPGVEPGIESIRNFYAGLWSAFPDAELTIEDTVEAGDKLAARFTLRATHRGEFMGVAATNRRVTATGITILRFQNGRCVERWSEANFLALLQQIS